MTPEERARSIILPFRNLKGALHKRHCCTTRKAIVAAIRAAIEAEREACAETAEFEAEALGNWGPETAAFRIGEAIRARKEAKDETHRTGKTNADEAG